jgi:predicted transposase YbfD/YdcC
LSKVVRAHWGIENHLHWQRVHSTKAVMQL